ncbi:MAG: hypothetical protein HN936_06955 [Bacteroidetes bacterium]|jgi:hypothetical protein|nr:hypothetical protein [Bacteroidota bacterium]MBT7465551.1 hypothetical protein [Bacteroidota bacterium]
MNEQNYSTLSYLSSLGEPITVSEVETQRQYNSPVMKISYPDHQHVPSGNWMLKFGNLIFSGVILYCGFLAIREIASTSTHRSPE